MGSRPDDLHRLAAILDMPVRPLRAAVGRHWHAVTEPQQGFNMRQGPLFVGREGPSVAIDPMWIVFCTMDPETMTLPTRVELTVGVATGTWNCQQLEWRITDPTAVITLDSGDDPTEFLAELKEAVATAAEAKKPLLRTCTHCGTVMAPEHQFGDDCCHGCATTVHDVVF